MLRFLSSVLDVPSAVPTNQANAVVAAVVGLGLASAEISTTPTFSTRGWKGIGRAKVSFKNMYRHRCNEAKCDACTYVLTHTYPRYPLHRNYGSGCRSHQSHQRNRVRRAPHVPSVAPANPANSVVAVVVVLGFERCGDLGDSKFEYTWMEGIRACQSKLRICTYPSL